MELDKKDTEKLTALLQLSKISIQAGLKQRPNLIVKRKLNQLQKALIEISEKLGIEKDLEINIEKHL